MTKVLAEDDVAALFGLDMAGSGDSPVVVASPSPAPRRVAKTGGAPAAKRKAATARAGGRDRAGRKANTAAGAGNRRRS